MACPVVDAGMLDTVELPGDGTLELLDARVVGGSAEGSSVGEHVEGHAEGIRAEGEIRRCLLESVDLSGSRLHPLTLTDVRMSGMEISNAQWHSVSARRVELTSARAVGLGLSLDFAADLYVAETRLDYAGVHIKRVRGHVVFSDCSFREATLSGDLSRVIFRDCDFTGAEFTATAAWDTDLRSSRLADARGLHSLRGAVIDVDQVIAIAGQLAAEAGLRVGD